MKKIKKGMILLSEPYSPDQLFYRSTILISEMNTHGSMGFILNRLIADDLYIDLPELNFRPKFYLGGPIAANQLFYIYYHQHAFISDSISITPNIHFGGNYGELVQAFKSENLKEKDVRFFLGYSGWSAEQLDEEMNEKSWTVVEHFSEKHIIYQKTQSLWSDLMKKNKQWAYLSRSPENILNN